MKPLGHEPLGHELGAERLGAERLETSNAQTAPQKKLVGERTKRRARIAIPGPSLIIKYYAYPQRPHPKDAVKRIQKTTIPTIHKVSLLMVLLL